MGKIIKAGINPKAVIYEICRIAVINALAEIIDNGFDAGTNVFNIYTDQPENPQHMVMLDYGVGMDGDALDAFFNWGTSGWRGQKAKGTNGKGSKYILGHSNEIKIRTKTANDRLVTCIPPLNLETWLEMTLKGQVFETDEEKLGEHPHDPPNDSFTLIEIFPKEDRNNYFNEEYLLDNLGEFLSPQFADRVFVNGKSLKPRKVVSGFEHSEKDALLGMINAYIYKPEKLTYREQHKVDDLRIGSIGPVIDFRAFVRELPISLRKQIPAIFFDRSVCGLIEVEAFNKWREGASKEFREELYRSKHCARFIKYLQSILGPKIEQSFGLESSNLDDKTRKNLGLLSEVTQNAFGKIHIRERPKPPQFSVSFNMSPRTITMVPGMTEIFRAKGTRKDRFEWDSSDVPGTLDTTTGPEVQLTIPENADYDPNRQYQLMVKKMPSGIRRYAYIRIVPSPQMSIIPGSGITKYVNDMITFRVINVPKEIDTMHWHIEPPELGELTKRTGSKIALALRKAGKITVTAFDPEDPEIKCSADVYVKPEEKITVTPTDSVPRIRLEDMTFEVRITGRKKDQSTIGILGADDESSGIFHLNKYHPRYMQMLKTADSAWREFILNWMVTQYVLFKFDLEGHENITRVEINQRIGEILSQLTD